MILNIQRHSNTGFQQLTTWEINHYDFTKGNLCYLKRPGEEL